jgi:hypothetical protein
MLLRAPSQRSARVLLFLLWSSWKARLTSRARSGTAIQARDIPSIVNPYSPCLGRVLPLRRLRRLGNG